VRFETVVKHEIPPGCGARSSASRSDVACHLPGYRHTAAILYFGKSDWPPMNADERR
jgi:hypothetical protein